jgi:hypothetical protein
MSSLILMSRRKWSATLMGIVCGIIFFTIPAPAPYLLPSTVISGLIFDLVLIIGTKNGATSISQTLLLTGAGLSGLAESLVALTIITLYNPSILEKVISSLAVTWTADLVLNIVLSIVGAFIAFKYLSGRVPRNGTKLTSQ